MEWSKTFGGNTNKSKGITNKFVHTHPPQRTGTGVRHKHLGKISATKVSKTLRETPGYTEKAAKGSPTVFL